MPKVATFSLLILLVSGCRGGQERKPIPSPDGSMTLHTRVEQSQSDPRLYRCVIFEIRDGSGRVLHTENTRASDLSRWTVSWVGNDRIHLESSDIGAYEWRRQTDSRWLRALAQSSAGGPPA